MKTLLSTILCAACLGTMSLSARADISPEPHKMPLPKNLAQAVKKAGDDLTVELGGLFAVKGNPVAIWKLMGASAASVYLCPGKIDGKWGKAHLALKELPFSFFNDEGGVPAVVHNPDNSHTLLFYLIYPESDDGESGDIEYFVARGKGAKVSPKAHQVKRIKGMDDVRPCSPSMPGIVLKHGEHKGRIVLMVGSQEEEARSFYSDDRGHTWKAGKSFTPPFDNKWSGKGSSTIVGDGYPLFEDEKGHISAYVCTSEHTWLRSEDGGESWKKHSLSQEEVKERRLKASRTKWMPPAFHDGDSLILNAGDARGNNSRLLNFCSGTDGVTVSLSYDWGVTWPYSKRFVPAPYCAIDGAVGCAVLRPGVIGVVLFKDSTAEDPDSRYAYSTLTLSWLTDGADDGTSLPGAGAEETGDDSPEP